MTGVMQLLLLLASAVSAVLHVNSDAAVQRVLFAVPGFGAEASLLLQVQGSMSCCSIPWPPPSGVHPPMGRLHRCSLVGHYS